MKTAPPQFAHVFLFACPVCFRPLVAACNSTSRNLEVADSFNFSSQCHYGWSGDVIGMKAKSHWVEAWFNEAPVGTGIAGSCDGDLAPGT